MSKVSDGERLKAKNKRKDVSQFPSDFSESSGFSYDDENICDHSESEFRDLRGMKKGRQSYSSTSDTDASYSSSKVT